MPDNKEPIMISIKGIREVKSIYEDPQEFHPEFNAPEIKSEIKLQVKYSWNLEDKRFSIYTQFCIDLKKDNVKASVFNYTCVSDFEVEKLKELLVKGESGRFEMDPHLEESLLRLAVGHGRGMLSQKMSQTKFRNFVYPLVDINSLMISNQPGGIKSNTEEKEGE